MAEVRPREKAMADVFDVGAYILREIGPLHTRKLHKLIYYAQAWSLTIRGQPLFSDAVEAWKEGPVVRRLYETHPGEKAPLHSVPGGNADALSTQERQIVQAVLAVYGEEDAVALIKRTHKEKPWNEARPGLPASARSSTPITAESMTRYYSRCRERADIDVALAKLAEASFMSLVGKRSGSDVPDRMLEIARRTIRDRAALPREEPDAWVRRMTEKLAGAND